MFHLAQANIAHMRGLLIEPVMTGFVQRLDEINMLADSSPGFVWRYQSAKPDILYQGKNIVFNMSVWKTLKELKEYVYNTAHLELLKTKADWFNRLDTPHMALWWVPVGYTPSMAEGLAKIKSISEAGISEQSFTFSQPYSPA